MSFYKFLGLLGALIAGWLIGVTIDSFRGVISPIGQVVLIVSCILLLVQSFIVWFKIK